MICLLLNSHLLKVALTLQVAINNQTFSVPWFNHLLNLRRCPIGIRNIGNRSVDIFLPEVGEMIVSAVSTGVTRLEPQW